MSFHAVIFDLDGTLLDTLEDIALSANTVLAGNGLPSHPLSNYRSFVGDGVTELMARALPAEKRSPDTVAEYVRLFRQEYRLHWNVKTKPYPGIAEALDELQSRHLTLAILSNKPHDFTLQCVEEMLPKWKFEIILGHRSDIAPKPNPQGAQLIAEKLSLDPTEVMFVGDSDNDMRAATGAGMFPVGVLWGFRSAEELRKNGAKALVSHAKELVALLDSQPA